LKELILNVKQILHLQVREILNLLPKIKWTKYGWESNLKRLFTGVEAALADPIAAITLEGDGSILFAGFVSSKFGVLPGFISGGDILERVSSELECLRRRSSIYNENVIN